MLRVKFCTIFNAVGLLIVFVANVSSADWLDMEYEGSYTVYNGGFSASSYDHNVDVYLYPGFESDRGDAQHELPITNGSNVWVRLPPGYSIYKVALVSGCWYAKWLLTALSARGSDMVEVARWELTGCKGNKPCLNPYDGFSNLSLFWNQLLRAEILPLATYSTKFKTLDLEGEDGPNYIDVKLISDISGRTGFELLVLAK